MLFNFVNFNGDLPSVVFISLHLFGQYLYNRMHDADDPHAASALQPIENHTFFFHFTSKKKKTEAKIPPDSRRASVEEEDSKTLRRTRTDLDLSRPFAPIHLGAFYASNIAHSHNIITAIGLPNFGDTSRESQLERARSKLFRTLDVSSGGGVGDDDEGEDDAKSVDANNNNKEDITRHLQFQNDGPIGGDYLQKKWVEIVGKDDDNGRIRPIRPFPSSTLDEAANCSRKSSDPPVSLESGFIEESQTPPMWSSDGSTLTKLEYLPPGGAVKFSLNPEELIVNSQSQPAAKNAQTWLEVFDKLQEPQPPAPPPPKLPAQLNSSRSFESLIKALPAAHRTRKISTPDKYIRSIDITNLEASGVEQSCQTQPHFIKNEPKITKTPILLKKKVPPSLDPPPVLYKYVYSFKSANSKACQCCDNVIIIQIQTQDVPEDVDLEKIESN